MMSANMGMVELAFDSFHYSDSGASWHRYLGGNLELRGCVHFVSTFEHMYFIQTEKENGEQRRRRCVEGWTGEQHS